MGVEWDGQGRWGCDGGRCVGTAHSVRHGCSALSRTVAACRARDAVMVVGGRGWVGVPSPGITVRTYDSGTATGRPRCKLTVGLVMQGM